MGQCDLVERVYMPHLYRKEAIKFPCNVMQQYLLFFLKIVTLKILLSRDSEQTAEHLKINSVL
jgi:hypothetical protein